MQKKRVLGVLVSLTFAPDPLIAWRAVEAFGAAADRIAETNPDYVRSHLRRLQWLMSDESGGVCWYAPQAMAEIIRRRPSMFPDYAAIVISFIHTVEEEDLAQFRPGILWAIGRLAPVAANEFETVLPHIEACLDHLDPQVRGMAVWCLKQAGRQSPIDARTDLATDDGPVELYENGRIEQTSVRALVDM
ncbi:MAG: hypothetical protein JSW58_09075 [Candidatus Latescibacterota bacterium]|nr:MAG: hypothetical protein JSW58_09075 [Candidatus Latescibacterota bacterium]